MTEVSYRSTKDGAIDDLRRTFAMATGGALAFAPVEYVLSLVAYQGDLSLGAKLRFVALDATLSIFLCVLLTLGLGAITAGSRLVRAGLYGPETGRARGWFDARRPIDGVRPGVPVAWAVIATGGCLALVLQRFAAWAIEHFKEPQLTAVLVAIGGLAAIAVAAPLCRALMLGCRAAAVGLAPMFGIVNPLGRWRAMGLAIAGLVGASLAATWFVLPQSRSVLPVRLAISAVVIALGMGLGARYFATHRRRRLSRPAAMGGALAMTAFMTVTLVWWGADLETRYIVTPQTALDRLVDVVRLANDVDRDGFGSLLGENDCGPFDRAIYPDAPDLPDDGIDQN
ncbi:MAG: hypothetical protein NT062_19430, partial [Proteobacteria bacterium]|nr:hypothetical protein [Pseudomonadota bacterium]